MTKKHWLALANQVRLTKLELAEMRQETSHSALTINKPPRHTRACTASDASNGPLRKKPRSVESYQKALEPLQYNGQAHREYLKFVCACNQVFDTQPDAYCNDRSKIIYTREYLFKDVQDA